MPAPGPPRTRDPPAPAGGRLPPATDRGGRRGGAYARIAANREYLSRWAPWAPRQTLAGTLGFIRESQARAEAAEGLDLAIVCAGRIAGSVGANAIDRPNRSTSLGYRLAEDHQGRGIVTQGTAALVGHAITSWGLNRIEVRAATENHRSRAIPERLSFQYEGTLREAQWLGERVVDHAVYAMLADDWGRRPAG